VLRNLIRILMTAAVMCGPVLVGVGDAHAAPMGRCTVPVVRNGIPDYEKRWCDQQYDAASKECFRVFHDDAYKAQKCHAEALKWYMECLDGKHLHYRLAATGRADRLRP